MRLLRLFTLPAFALLASTAMPTASASEPSPTANSCALVSLLPKQGLSAATERFKEVVAWLDDALAGQMVSAFQLLGDRKFAKADAFVLAELPGYAAEHLLAVDVEDDGIVYVRMAYVRYQGALRIAHFSIDDNYEKLLARRSFNGTLQKLECPLQ
ncbi:MAG: hypothetical protein AAGJ70_01585 [Pseudomonadota bacterium]